MYLLAGCETMRSRAGVGSVYGCGCGYTRQHNRTGKRPGRRLLETGKSDNFDFQVNCKILNFHLTRFRGRKDPEVVENQGEQFNASVRELLKTAQPGDRLLFDEIRVKCGEEPSPRTLAGLSLRVE
ncbi:MAG: hypothetical protein IT262_09490 [Saprospiraceae bacterium]|nr:hypothetical protein [Saprospiraceae bacterium]